MSDKLEQFIKENRGAMDPMEPPKGLWDKISKENKPGKSKTFNLNYLWKAAAIVFFAITLGLWLQQQENINQKGQVADKNSPEIELAQVEQYYNSLISKKINTLVTDESLSAEVEKKFLQDVEKLDAAYQQLKQQLEHTSNEKIKDAMIVNLQMRIELLNQQLEILNNIKKVKKDEKAYNI